jgi:hypothetical protein
VGAYEAAAQVAAHKSFGIALGLGPHPVLPCKLYIDILPYPSPQIFLKHLLISFLL